MTTTQSFKSNEAEKPIRLIEPREQGENGLYVCPCCGYAVFDKPSQYEICDICFWEDNGVDDPMIEEIFDPNGVSLSQARQNFLIFGASDKRLIECVRVPNDSDEQVRQLYLK